MKTSNLTTTATRITTFLAIFGFIAFAGETTWAQKGNGAGKSGSHQQAASKSKHANNTPKVNQNDKTFRFRKTISAGPRPLPTVDRDDKYRRRGTLVQNGGNPIAQGVAGSGDPIPTEPVPFTFLRSGASQAVPGATKQSVVDYYLKIDRFSTPHSGVGQAVQGTTNQRTTNQRTTNQRTSNLPRGSSFSVCTPYSSLNLDNTTAVRSRGAQAEQGNQIVAGNFIETNQQNNKDPDGLSNEPLSLSTKDQKTGEFNPSGPARVWGDPHIDLRQFHGGRTGLRTLGSQSESSLNSLARPQSLVESEGWDEVPEELMFQSRSLGKNQLNRGLDGLAEEAIPSNTAHSDGPGFVSPRDPASGQATGKSK